MIAFPLSWPTGWPRTPDGRRAHSRYEPAFARDREALLRRLKGMGATGVVISTNVPLRRDGLPLANTAQPRDPGVAVYFTRRKRDHVVACDAWRRVDENLRAVLRTLDALASIERSGSAQLEDRAFEGFARLPASTRPRWPSVLGVDPSASIAEIEAAYRRLAREHHPDRGGSPERMVELNQAIAEARASAGGGV